MYVMKKKEIIPQGLVIAFVRNRYRISQEKLAHEMGISQSTLSRMEAGEVKAKAKHFRVLERISRLPLNQLVQQALQRNTDETVQQQARISDVFETLDKSELSAMTCVVNEQLKKLMLKRGNKLAALETEKDHVLLYQTAFGPYSQALAASEHLKAECQRAGLFGHLMKPANEQVQVATEKLHTFEMYSKNRSAMELATLQLEVEELNAQIADKEKTLQRIQALLGALEAHEQRNADQAAKAASEALPSQAERAVPTARSKEGNGLEAPKPEALRRLGEPAKNGASGAMELPKPNAPAGGTEKQLEPAKTNATHNGKEANGTGKVVPLWGTLPTQFHHDFNSVFSERKTMQPKADKAANAASEAVPSSAERIAASPQGGGATGQKARKP